MASNSANAFEKMERRLSFLRRCSGTTLKDAEMYLELAGYDVSVAVEHYERENAEVVKNEFVKKFTQVTGKTEEIALEFYLDGNLQASLDRYYDREEHEDAFISATGASDAEAQSFCVEFPDDHAPAITDYSWEEEDEQPVLDDDPRRLPRPAPEWTGDEKNNVDLFDGVDDTEKAFLIKLAKNNDRVEGLAYILDVGLEYAQSYFRRHNQTLVSAVEFHKDKEGNVEVRDDIQSRMSKLWKVRNRIDVHRRTWEIAECASFQEREQRTKYYYPKRKEEEEEEEAEEEAESETEPFPAYDESVIPQELKLGIYRCVNMCLVIY
jgi:hypothetical protein